MLYLHSDLDGKKAGVNLRALMSITGIPAEAVVCTNPLQLHMGIPGEVMAGIYNTFDALAMPSYGEGFGVPIVEAQACGVPVIVTDWTAMPELCGAGWLVDGDPFYDPPHGSYYKCPSIGSVLDAMESAYAARGDAALQAQAREFALGYDVERVTEEFWVPALAALDRPREVPPLRVASNGSGNRAQRRAAAKAGVSA